jgi:hypothetical protein
VGLDGKIEDLDCLRAFGIAASVRFIGDSLRGWRAHIRKGDAVTFGQQEN